MLHPLLRLASFTLTLALPGVAAAETFHVAPGGDDDAPGSSAAPFATPAGCFEAMAPGDTCLFESGRWDGPAPRRYYPRWNACEGPRGTPGAPTIYAAAPGATPVFESFGISGTDGHGECHDIEVRGLTTTESFLVWSAARVRVTECEMSGGMDRDGNWSAVRVERVEDLMFDHNWVGDLADCPGCREQALVTVFTTSRAVFEHNTLDATRGVRPQFGALMLKDSPIDQHVRFNLVLGHHILGSNQNADGREGRDLRIYGNVVIGGSIQSWVRTLDTSIHHNTIVRGALIADGSHSPGLRMFGNVVTETTHNVVIEESYWAGLPEIFLDHNVYSGDAEYVADRYGDSQRELSSLSTWRDALRGGGCVGCEESSVELDCAFVPGPDTDFHVAGGPCASAGPDGGEAGAYALTSCVGHLCTDPPVETDAGVGGLDSGVPEPGSPRDGGTVDPMDPPDAMQPPDAMDPMDAGASSAVGAGCSTTARADAPHPSPIVLGLALACFALIRRGRRTADAR